MALLAAAPLKPGFQLAGPLLPHVLWPGVQLAVRTTIDACTCIPMLAPTGPTAHLLPPRRRRRRVLAMQPFLNATRLSLHLYCNITATPWCERGAIGKRVAPAIRHAAAVHAVVGS